MLKRSLSLGKVYRLLEPGPVVLLTTANRRRANVMAMSWHTMVDFEPPLVGIIVSNRNYTFDILKSTKECVINIPTATLAKQVVGCGNVSGRDVDKFARFGFTQVAASMVRAAHRRVLCESRMPRRGYPDGAEVLPVHHPGHQGVD